MRISPLMWRLLFAAALVVVALISESRAATCDYCDQPFHVPHVYAAQPQPESWVFAQARYTHDPETGARVAQYQEIDPVEPLPDQRHVTSGYRRVRTVLRGADGSTDTTHTVTNYGNGRGGLDAEWERFHDAWRGSTTAGGNFAAFPPFGFGFGGFPGYGFGPGFGPGYGGPGPGGPGHGGQFPGHGRHGSFQFPDHRGFGPGFGRPDAGWLDPDATDGYPDGRQRTPDRSFFQNGNPSSVPKKRKKKDD